MPLMPMPPMPTKWICWYFLNMATMRPRVLRDVQQDTRREERHEERRASEGDEGQRQPLGRQRPRHHAEIHEGLGREHDGQPERQVAAEGVRRAQPDPQAPPHEEHEERHHDHGARQPQLLADDGEDEIGVGLRQVEELLLGLAQPAPEPPARGQRQEGLDDLEARALRVVPRVHEGDHAPQAVGLHRDSDRDHRQRRGRRSVPCERRARRPDRPGPASGSRAPWRCPCRAGAWSAPPCRPPRGGAAAGPG